MYKYPSYNQQKTTFEVFFIFLIIKFLQNVCILNIKGRKNMEMFGLSVFEICGYIAGICTAICFLPQTIQTIKTQNVTGLSLASYIIYAMGMLNWIIYGAYLNSVQMIVFNAPALLFSLIIVCEIVYDRYYKKDSK